MDPKKFKTFDEAAAAGISPVYYHTKLKDAMEMSRMIMPPTIRPGEKCDVMFGKTFKAYFLKVCVNISRSDAEEVVNELREMGIVAVRVNDEGEEIQ